MSAIETLTENQQLVLDTIAQKPTDGIPTWQILTMEWAMIDRLAGVPEGTYVKDPVGTMRKKYENIGTCMVDQWIPTNALSMTSAGYESEKAGGSPTTGNHDIVHDGIAIREPEDVVAHMEKHLFPELEAATRTFDADAFVAETLESEAAIQAEIGPTMLKTPYVGAFPCLHYGYYTYEQYFMAYALYPEVMEQCFRLQADLAVVKNRALVRAYDEGNLPRYTRLDHDMVDSRGPLVDIKSLDRMWFPEFARSVQPLIDAGIKCIWHCDGNQMPMIPRLLEVGLAGFQGFQYEDGNDWEAICKMTTRDGDSLLLIGGVSVTTTLPHGTPQDVRDEMAWLVKHAPKVGFFLGGTSSVAPGVPWENIEAFVEGLKYYH
ncbi:MAG: uroporphyrinogen decarboxylase family protein, partial [Planctomycetota bacterium]